jgi:hypothetical protein
MTRCLACPLAVVPNWTTVRPRERQSGSRSHQGDDPNHAADRERQQTRAPSLSDSAVSGWLPPFAHGASHDDDLSADVAQTVTNELRLRRRCTFRQIAMASL